MRKVILKIFLVLAMVLAMPLCSGAESVERKPPESNEMIYRDMLMLFLLPHIDKAIADYYSGVLSVKPVVYPYLIDVIKTYREGEGRRFHFFITLETTPVVGPHITVGKDRLTLEIAPVIPDQVKLIEFEHLETYKLPPHWQDIIITGLSPQNRPKKDGLSHFITLN